MIILMKYFYSQGSKINVVSRNVFTIMILSICNAHGSKIDELQNEIIIHCTFLQQPTLCVRDNVSC